jgi:hypothetical protein
MMTNISLKQLLLFNLITVLGIIPVQCKGVATHGSRERKDLYLWQGQILFWEKARIGMAGKDRITEFAVAEALQIVGPVTPGSNVNVVYAKDKGKDIVVLIQLQPQIRSGQAATGSNVLTEAEPLVVPPDMAKRIRKVVGPIRATTLISEPRVMKKEEKKVSTVVGQVRDATVISKCETTLSIVDASRTSPSSFVVDLLTSVYGELAPDVAVRITYTSLHGKQVATKIEVEQQVAPEITHPSVRRSEPEHGGVSSIEAPPNSEGQEFGAKREHAVTGCLQRGDEPGEFFLTGEDGKTWGLYSSTVNLEQHVGRKVTVTGSGVRESGVEEKKEGQVENAGAKAEYGALRVTNLKMVSDSCSE